MSECIITEVGVISGGEVHPPHTESLQKPTRQTCHGTVDRRTARVRGNRVSPPVTARRQCWCPGA